jgi:hypothetical protein
VTALHDSHAIGTDDPPPVLDLLLAAIRAALVVLRSPITSGASASDAITAYAKAAGIGTDDATERILAAVQRVADSPAFTGNAHDARVIAFWAQSPKPGEQFVRPGGPTFTVRHRRGSLKRLELWASGFWSARQATRRGPLVRLDLLHAPVTRYDAAPGAQEPDAVYQVCAHDGEPWPCRTAVSAGIAQEPVVEPAVTVEFATEAPF